jgi:DNA sulfur modification protein DndD
VDGLQLALFENVANFSIRESLGYEDFLRRSIHRSVYPHEGAAVEVEISHISDGKEGMFRIHRPWFPAASTVRERFEVI